MLRQERYDALLNLIVVILVQGTKKFNFPACPSGPLRASCSQDVLGGGHCGALNTAKNIAEHRITARKVDGSPSTQYIVLV